MTTDIEFTVEALSGQRIVVCWEDATHRYWFYVEHDGDQITKVVPSSGHRVPTITRRRLGSMGVGAARYFDAGAPNFAPIILNATRFIRERKLITQAVKARDELLADREALVIVQNMPDVFLHRVAAILGCD